MLKNFYKTFLCFILLACISFATFACGNGSSEKQSDKQSQSPTESADVQPDAKIEAVVENEPEGYVTPKIDFVTKKFIQPSLTDEEMYAVVFENLSATTEGDNEGKLPELDYGKGEAYFSYSEGESFKDFYKCDGISTDVELSDEFTTFKIITDVLTPSSHSTAPVDNAYWHKYLDVMIRNLKFTAVESNDEKFSVLAYVYEKNATEEKAYMVCSDGYVRTKSADDAILKSDKKVDAPKIYLVADLFERLHNLNYINTVAYVPLPNENLTFHYNGKTATIKKADAAKLGHIDEHEYKVTKTLVNQKFIDSDDYIYVEIGDGKYYVIDKDSNLYYVWNNFYTVKLTGGYAAVQCQIVREIKGVFDYSKIIELFK